MKEFIKNFDEEKLREAFRIKESYKRGEIPLDMANAQMKAHVGNLTPAQIAYIEQTMQEELKDECTKEDIKEMMAIFDGVLIEEAASLINGHPIKNYIDENDAIRKVLSNIDNLYKSKYIKNVWDEEFEKLEKFKIHLSRKQNQLYTALEKKGFDRPTTTMWLYDNQIRDGISELSEFISKDFDMQEFIRKYEDFKIYILDLMQKEEEILYPTSLEILDDKDFNSMPSGDREIGYCLIEVSKDFEQGIKKDIKCTVAENDNKDGFKQELSDLLAKYNINSWTPDTKMDVSEGLLSLNQINLLFKHLPVDISYVDENELVAFYSDTKHRVFPRSKGVIGRDVKNCHPKNSVAIVEEIIEKFRSGKEDRAEFWINKKDVFIYIVYVAVRDEEGNFRGVMEMMQDCSRIRKLEGSQTLLSWSSDKKNDLQEDAEDKGSGNEEKNIEEAEDKLESGDNILELKKDMKIESVFKQYPDFKEYLISKYDKFQIMNSPMYKMMKAIATVEMVSERSGLSIEQLNQEFKEFLSNRK